MSKIENSLNNNMELINSTRSKETIRLEKNIKLDYVYKFLSSIDIGSAIWVLYMAFKGMSLVEIGLLESIYHATSIICEIPTGSIADIMGRRKTIIVGRLMSAVSAIIMLFSYSFIGFAASFVISAISNNLNSGSEEALVYDSLKAVGKEEEYLRINGTLNLIIEISQGIAVLLGGILSDFSFGYSYVLAIIISLCTFGISFGFTEPDIHGEKKDKVTVAGHFKECFRVMKNNKKIILIMMFFELIFMTGTTTHFYSQQYFSDMGYSRSIISVIFVVASIGCALVAKAAYRIERVLKLRILYMAPIIGAVSLIIIGLGEGATSILGFILFSMSINILYPVSSTYINKLIPSAQRATLISVQSMCFSVFMIVIFPMLGWIGEATSLKVAFIILSGILILIGLCTFKTLNTTEGTN